MKWRFSKLDWKYGIGELIIVTVGVLIALYIEQWNSNRLDQQEEIEIIERIITDINIDLIGIEIGERATSNKIPALQRLANNKNESTPSMENTTELFEDIRRGASWGWNQSLAQPTTYNELLGAGNFGLIQNSSLRNQVSRYYGYYEIQVRRIDERETEFPSLTYKLAPIVESTRELQIVELEKLKNRLRETDVQELILAEENFAFFAQARLIDLRERAEELINSLEEYHAQIR